MCFQTDILSYCELSIQHFKNLGLLPRSVQCPICRIVCFQQDIEKHTIPAYRVVLESKKDHHQKNARMPSINGFTDNYKNLCGKIDLSKTKKLLLIFVSISTSFIYSRIDFLVKKQFLCCMGEELPTRCTWEIYDMVQFLLSSDYIATD